MSLADDQRRLLLEGRAYTDPTPPFGRQLVMQSQSYEDQTLTFLYRAVAEMGRRLTLAEARLCLLEAILKDEL